MIDPSLAPLLVLLTLAAALVVRDARSIKNLQAFFDAADKVMEAPDEAAPIADDIATMSRSLLNPRLARRMAWMAARGRLAAELRAPTPRVRAFAQRWGRVPEAQERRQLLRRFVWELTRASLVFGSLLGLWLLLRGAHHWRDDNDRSWAILAAIGLGAGSEHS